MEASKMKGKESFLINRRAFGLCFGAMPMAFVSTAVSELFGTLAPYVSIFFTARLIDEIAGECREEYLVRLVIAVLLTGVLMTLCTQVLRRWKNSVHATVHYRNEGIFLHKLMSMDFAAVDDAHTHDLYSQIRQNQNWSNWGLERIHWQFEQAFISLVKILGATALCCSLFIREIPPESSLAWLNHPLFLAAILIFMAVTAVLSPALSNQTGKYWVKYTENALMGNRIFSFFGYSVGQSKERALDIRMYRQDKLCRKKLEESDSFLETSQIAKWARGPVGGFKALSAAVSRMFIGSVYLLVCLKAWGGAFGVGSVTQYISAVTALFNGVSSFLMMLGDMKNNSAYLKKVFELLDIPNDMYKGSLTVEKRSDKKYEVEFRDVSFRYPSMDTWALRHVSMKFRVGERLAVVGSNGSGKTTMIKLLCRLYDPTEGQILLNGIDIRKYNYAEYMNIFSVVFQDFQLLDYGLGQNVAGGMKYDEERVKACLTDAGLGERLASMEKGLDTCIGRGIDRDGVEISGGEAQKVAIARALYKDAPFIVLDEPTAALDPVAEMEIYSRFDALIRDKTAIYISHRLSSCRFCDRIAVFDQGKIVQFGNHEELVTKTDGKYYELWNAQAQYYV